MENISRILVVSRMTRLCSKAVRYGVSLAKVYQADLFVIQVMHDPHGLEGWSVPMFSIEEEYKKDRQKAKKELDAIIKKENDKGLSIKTLIAEGNPTEEIMKVIHKEKIDLLILHAHEEGRLEHFLFGSSNEELIRRMPCSILLVKKELQAEMI